MLKITYLSENHGRHTAYNHANLKLSLLTTTQIYLEFRNSQYSYVLRDILKVKIITGFDQDVLYDVHKANNAVTTAIQQ